MCNECFQLLERNIGERLGYKAGKNGDIRRHEFFAKLNWRQLEARRIEAPYKPKIVSNFEHLLVVLVKCILHIQPNIASVLKYLRYCLFLSSRGTRFESFPISYQC
jgi:hypothetical protein